MPGDAAAAMPRKRTRTEAASPGRLKVVESRPFLYTKGNAMLGRVGIPELIIILMIIILIFGANRLPEIGRGIGKGIKNFKDSTREGQNDGKA
jgi:sec-independent protein translocase protein TatA